MLDFRGSSAAAAEAARQRTRTVLLLVLCCGVVLIAVQLLRSAALLQWLEAGGGWLGQRGGMSIDNRLDPPENKEDALPMVVAPGTKTPQADEQQSDDTEGYFPGVKPGYLQHVRDDAIFRPEETNAWFNLLSVLRNSKQQDLEAAVFARPTYAQLFRQSEQYRGKIVQVKGVMRRAHYVRAVANDAGIQGYYLTWLFPYDNPHSPMVLYVLELPQGFPTGMTIAEEVEATGFFFKRLAYAAQDRPRTAPAVLARNIVWHQRPVLSPAEPPGTATWLLAIGGALLVSAGFVAVVVLRTRRSAPPGSLEKVDFSALEKLVQPDKTERHKPKEDP